MNTPTAPGLTLTAMDMGRALFQSDAAPHRASVAKCADACSYITRVLFGRNLMVGRGPIRVDLKNGHHLLITMRADDDTASVSLSDLVQDVEAMSKALEKRRPTLSKEQRSALKWAVRQACNVTALKDAINDDRGPQHRAMAKKARAALEVLS